MSRKVISWFQCNYHLGKQGWWAVRWIL